MSAQSMVKPLDQPPAEWTGQTSSREGLRRLSLAVLLVGLSGFRFVISLFLVLWSGVVDSEADIAPGTRPTRPRALLASLLQ